MKALGSLADGERALRADGFLEGGGEGLVADLYLGYGLSRSLRRTDAPDPPEPCPLPQAAFRIRPADEEQPMGGTFRIGHWECSWTDDEYARAIESVKDSIARGSVYQVNLVQHLSAPFRGDPAGF